jgi:predicted RND superfamily exporter protein
MFARRYCGIEPKGVFAAQAPALLAACITGAITFAALRLLTPYLNAVALLAMLVLIGAATYAALAVQLLPDFAAQFTSKLPARFRRAPDAR